jgi:hypothetical protein
MTLLATPYSCLGCDRGSGIPKLLNGRLKRDFAGRLAMGHLGAGVARKPVISQDFVAIWRGLRTFFW